VIFIKRQAKIAPFADDKINVAALAKRLGSILISEKKIKGPQLCSSHSFWT
jgi:hypothetical protein